MLENLYIFLIIKMLGQLLHPPNGWRGHVMTKLALAQAHSYLGC